MGPIEPIAPLWLHEKVFEIATGLPGTEVLDVPAGHGALTEKLLDAGKTVTAGDIDTGKFRLPADRAGLTLLRLDMNEPHLPLPDGHFDMAVCVEGVEHLQAPWNFVRNLNRVLKPGGYLVITTPNILNLRSRLRFFMEGRYEHFKRPLALGKSWPHDLANYHIFPVSFFDLRFLLESCGFVPLGVHTNRFRGRNLLTAALKPLFGLIYRHKAYRDGKRGRGDLGELYTAVLSDEVFFGECLVMLARKGEPG